MLLLFGFLEQAKGSSLENDSEILSKIKLNLLALKVCYEFLQNSTKSNHDQLYQV